MIGAIVVIIALVVVIPVSVIMSGGVLAGVIAHFLRTEGEHGHEGSEILDLHS